MPAFVFSTPATIGPKLPLRKHPPAPDKLAFSRQSFAFTGRAIKLVWQTSAGLTVTFALATLVAGLLPALIAYLGQLIVDAVVVAQNAFNCEADWPSERNTTLKWLAVEAAVVLLLASNQRLINTCQSLLRALLGQRVNTLILEKALTLSLAQFEDSEFYDKLTRARREASVRPLALVNKTFSLAQHGISLVSYAILLINFSFLALALLIIGALPVFFAEAKFSGDAFRLFRWRSPETRKQMYLETLLAREDSAKEVKLFKLGPLLLNKYREIFHALYKEDRLLTIKRETWGFLLGILGTGSFYVAYVWIIIATVNGQLTLGEMTMYLLVFKQGQASVSACLSAISGMYEDNLYLSNLYEYLEQPVPHHTGTATQGTKPGAGIEFDQVSFTYPGGKKPALANVSFTLLPGNQLAIVGENGSGKTTLIKLLTGLYQPSQGTIRWDGRPIQEWSPEALAEKISVIFQDFLKYQFSAGENLGAGNIDHFNDPTAWSDAANKGLSSDFIEQLKDGYNTQLGRWFKDGQELSGGQWQKIALSRLFIRPNADLLILDEPTSAVDARAEAQLFKVFRKQTQKKMSILISHRFSNVRHADQIMVLDKGKILETGNHQSLMASKGVYADLFQLQAKGFTD